MANKIKINTHLACPECHIADLRKFGFKWVGVNGHREQRQQYICKKCGRKTINPILAQPRDDKGRFIKVTTISEKERNE